MATLPVRAPIVCRLSASDVWLLFFAAFFEVIVTRNAPPRQRTNVIRSPSGKDALVVPGLCGDDKLKPRLRPHACRGRHFPCQVP